MLGKTLQNQPVRPEIFISKYLTEELIKISVDALPHKAFGLVGSDDVYHPKSLYSCCTNLGNDPAGDPIFESYGEFYQDPDLGFMISPPEVQFVLKTMDSRRESFVSDHPNCRVLSCLSSAWN